MRKPTGPYEEANIPEMEPSEDLLVSDFMLPGYYLCMEDVGVCSAAYDSAEQVRCLFGPMYGHPKEAGSRYIVRKPAQRYVRTTIIKPI